MNIHEFKKKKNDLESQISTVVSRMIEDFRKDTGFSPNSIYIQMLDVTTFNDKEKQYVIGNCHLDIEI